MSKLGSINVGNSNPVRIMGILNLSPESFFKKSIFTDKEMIENKTREMEEQGADFIDVGGMSTAPYLKTTIPQKIESERIVRAVKIIQRVSNLPISVDTCRSEVAKSALELGVDIINDISGLKYDKDMSRIVEKYNPSLVLCAFSKNLVRGNQIIQTRNLLRESITIAKSSHVSDNHIVIDPAIGFFRKKGNGKFFTRINSDWVKRDLLILNNLCSIKLGYPLLISVSRKSFIGNLLKIKNPNDRLYGSLAAESIAVLNGADIIRTHNVQETKEVITIAQKLSHSFRKGL
ncbi:MAG TPA: dihydropteroate synthase [Nitrosopumilaceae archaeon]|nr:dihydropteroate synthase [Nitrosopumilaceae archaeon]